MPSSATTALSRRPLKEVLEGVTDPRDRRGVRHPLVSAGCLAVTGILAGCRSLTAIWEHAADLEPADLGALGLEEGRALPSESTIRRVLKDLDPAGLDARLTSWFFTRTGAIAGRRVIAVEDETMRGARTGDNPAPHLLAAPEPGRRHGPDPEAGGRQVQRDPRPARAARPPGPRRCGRRRRRHAHPDRHRPVDHLPRRPLPPDGQGHAGRA